MFSTRAAASRSSAFAMVSIPFAYVVHLVLTTATLASAQTDACWDKSGGCQQHTEALMQKRRALKKETMPMAAPAWLNQSSTSSSDPTPEPTPAPWQLPPPNPPNPYTPPTPPPKKKKKTPWQLPPPNPPNPDTPPTPKPTPEHCSGTYEAEMATLSGPKFDASHTGYSGSGFADYLAKHNDYVEWSTVSCEGGAYVATFRYALAYGNRPLRLDVNGVAVLGSLAFPASGSWTTWTEVQTTITLSRGTNLVRLVAIGNSGANMDRLVLTKCSGTYEAEMATLSGPKIDASHTGYSGSGFVDYLAKHNDYVEWSTVICEDGAYVATFRYALARGNRPLRLDVNGVAVLGSLAFPASGSWTTWTEVQTTITLSRGTNLVRLVAIGHSGANMDRLVLTKGR